MPTTSFYITDEERMELFDFITKSNGVFIPDMLYDKPEIVQVHTKEELIKRINDNNPTFYHILSSDFQIEPLTFHQLDDEYEWCKFKYYINQRQGGPYIDISYSIGFAEDASIKYKCTDVDHYTRYLHWDWKTNYGEFLATEELKVYYQMLVKFLKSKCRKVTAKDGKKYWVSKTLKEEEVVG